MVTKIVYFPYSAPVVRSLGYQPAFLTAKFKKLYLKKGLPKDWKKFAQPFEKIAKTVAILKIPIFVSKLKFK